MTLVYQYDQLCLCGSLGEKKKKKFITIYIIHVKIEIVPVAPDLNLNVVYTPLSFLKKEYS